VTFSALFIRGVRSVEGTPATAAVARDGLADPRAVVASVRS
jgi:hypothetical protein